MKVDINKLSMLLLQIRLSKGFSQSYMAHRLNISQKAYCYLESGRCKMALIRFLQILHVTDSDPMCIIKEIVEENAFNNPMEVELNTLKAELGCLIQRVNHLQAHNDFLKNALERLLLLNSEKIVSCKDALD